MGRLRSSAPVFLCLAVLIAAAAGCGKPKTAGSMGGLTPYLPVGQEGAWLTEADPAAFHMSNTTDPGAVRYYLVAPAEGSQGKRKISVKVALDNVGSGAHAGLIYGFIPEPRQYFLFLLEPDGQAALWRRDAEGLNQVMSSSISGRTNPTELAIIEHGSEIELRANGQTIGSIGVHGVNGGSAGIAAAGTGRFSFSKFTHEPKPATPAMNTPVSAQTAPAGAPNPRPPGMAANNAGPPQGPALAARGNVLHLKRFDIMDPAGFGQPVVAATILAPVDWRLEGGITWNPNWKCMTDMVGAPVRIVSPDGRVGFEFLPQYTAEWQDDPTGRQVHAQALAMGQVGCPQEAPFTAAQFLQQRVVPSKYPGAGVMQTQPAPQVAQAFQDKVNAAIGGLGRFQADSARVLIRRNGTDEWLTATTGVLAQQAMSPSAAMQGGLQYQTSYTTTAQDVFGFFAPEGQMQSYEPLMQAIIGSLRINPQWAAAIQQTQGNINATIQKGVRDRAAIWRNAQQEIHDTQMGSWEASQAAQDRVMTRWSEAIRGTATYVDPSAGTQVELPDYYDSAWSNGVGEYILVEGQLNPNQYVQGNWSPKAPVMHFGLSRAIQVMAAEPIQAKPPARAGRVLSQLVLHKTKAGC